MKNWFSIKAAAKEGDPVEVSIFDEINSYYGVTARDFIAQFKTATAKASKVTLNINSPGGDVYQGLAIYNALKASGKEINVKVLGIAASMASVIAMAGTTIEMPKNSMMMVHNAWTAIAGDAEDLRERADILDKLDASIIGIYTGRTGKSEDDMRALMEADSYLTADEALAAGLATAVIDEVQAKAAFDLDGMPDNVKALFTGKAPEPKPEPQAPAAPLADQIKAAADAAGMGEFAAGWVVSIDNLADVQARIAAAREIKSIAGVVGMADAAAEMIRAGKTPAEARAEFQNRKAAADEALSVENARKTQQPKPKAADTLDVKAIYANFNKPRSAKE
jgi:ATP-dependent Clp endopeptidase proteolytic subunit ClpP